MSRIPVKLLKILYITRTFGPVGGMERYAFEVAREMALRGHQVSALCRSVDEPSVACSGVEIIKLQPKSTKHGWQDRYAFRSAVTEFFSVQANRRRFDIVHSHENTIEQNVTTEHGPCTAHGLSLKPWKRFALSARRNLSIEKEKFHSRNLKALVSCAERVQGIALAQYPHLAQKIIKVIPPAYSYLRPRENKCSGQARVLGFMGSDWKRKGLQKAVETFSVILQQTPEWTMKIAGVDPESLPARFLRTLPKGIEILGRTDAQSFFDSIDILIHPAREEPFGMVIPEALCCGVPVVSSDQCGAVAHLHSDGLRVLHLDMPANRWAAACIEMGGLKFPPPPRRSWSDISTEHEELYRLVLA